MGGKLSSILSNIYLNYVEQKVISPRIKNKEIQYFRRYSDDCLIVGNKTVVEKIFHELNNFNKSLKYTIEHFSENKLNFLDVQIYYDTQTKNYEFRSYQKKSKSNVIMNYKRTVAPLKYKISCLVGEIAFCSVDESEFEYIS